MNKSRFTDKIILWYETNKRNLPWRQTKDPYKIWLSEVILQQTRVAQGLPYYHQFIRQFPSVTALAKAPEEGVLRLWQGLGYYSRARNLHSCAKTIVKEYQGKFPTAYDELIKLPGIGSYTAAAIASIAFMQPVPVVDGNVFRVLARVFGYDLDIASPEGKKFFFAKAQELISNSHPDIYNQALMEFGALYCTPQNPPCDSCIFSDSCFANKHNMQKLLPVKAKKVKVKERHLNYFIIRCKNQILMQKREAKDIWQGLYDFYRIETKSRKPVPALDPKSAQLKDPGQVSDIIKHVLSHQHLFIRFIEIDIPAKKTVAHLIKDSTLAWYSIHQIHSLPKPVVIDKFLQKKTYFNQQ